ncbi:hypothetical protein GGR50DRAFT_664302 [Xylaria sp. CBS 124048]|nr:hypothetical protein GGR50DRAFT_664302 [Xylaria sp. CBS 124048]
MSGALPSDHHAYDSPGHLVGRGNPNQMSGPSSADLDQQASSSSSTNHLAGQPLTEFRYFAKLPCEIQSDIWDIAMANPAPAVVLLFFENVVKLHNMARAYIIHPPLTDIIGRKEMARIPSARTALTRQRRFQDRLACFDSLHAGRADILSHLERVIANDLGPFKTFRFSQKDKVAYRQGQTSYHEILLCAQAKQPFLLLGYHETYFQWDPDPLDKAFISLDKWPRFIRPIRRMCNIVVELKSAYDVARVVDTWDYSRAFEKILANFWGPLKNVNRREGIQYNILVDYYDLQGPPRKSLVKIDTDSPDLTCEQKEMMQFLLDMFNRWDTEIDRRKQLPSGFSLKPIEKENRGFVGWSKS